MKEYTLLIAASGESSVLEKCGEPLGKGPQLKMGQ